MTKTVITPRYGNKLQEPACPGHREHCSVLPSEPVNAPQKMLSPSPAYVVPSQSKEGMHKEAEGYGVDIQVRKASLADLEAIKNLVGYWAEMGENLPRAQHEIVRDIDSFAVVEEQGIVTGCASLHAYDSRLAEIRSLGVYSGAQRKGQGKALVEHMVEKARQMAIQKVFVLTRVPEFFKKQGFILTTRELLPEKIMKDCERCTRRHVCDEVALEVVLKQ